MNNTIKIPIVLTGISIGIGLLIGYIVWGGETLGNIAREQNAYSSALTHTSSTLTNSVATRVLTRATSSRSTAKICNRDGVERVWLYKQATSTGVAVNQGFPIYATSGTAWPQLPPCLVLDANDPYLGEIWAITSATTTITIESLQN